MTKLFLILLNLTITSQEFDVNIKEIKEIQEIPTVNINFEKTKSQNKQLPSSQKGFCSVDEAVEKLFFLSNTNWGGNTGLIQSYKAKLKNDCYPEKYYYPTLSASGNIYTVCYKLPDRCGGPQGKPYDPNYCALNSEGLKLQAIKNKLILERDNFIEKSAKEIEIKIRKIASKIIEEKLTQQLAKNPNEQLRLSLEDIYSLRSEIAKELSKEYNIYIVNVVLNEIGEFVFSNLDYFSPVISLSGPAGYVLLGSLPFIDEFIQCNLSIRNLILKGALKVGTKLVFKVPVIKNLEHTYNGSFAYEFIKSATISEASKWIKHYFGEGLEVKMVSPVKEYGKEFALITVEVVLNNYSNKK